MPTNNTVEAVAPGTKRTPSESVAFGRAQWTRKWRVFASQWSQPQLMKLAQATLGESAIHSSQIKGFATGQLRDPAPKLLIAVGQLNAAIAEANGKGPGVFSDHPQCPGHLQDLWEGKSFMTDADGVPLDAIGCFEAFTGLIDLGLDVRSGTLCAETMPHVNKAVGKMLRFALMTNGRDVLDIPQSDDVFNRLVWGKEVTAMELEAAVDIIAEMAGITTDQLWDEAIMPAVASS